MRGARSCKAGAGSSPGRPPASPAGHRTLAAGRSWPGAPHHDAASSAESLEEDLSLYFAEIERADRAIEGLDSLDSPGLGHGRKLGPTLIKMTQEYAVHNGQAHMLRNAALGEVIR